MSLVREAMKQRHGLKALARTTPVAARRYVGAACGHPYNLQTFSTSDMTKAAAVRASYVSFIQLHRRFKAYARSKVGGCALRGQLATETRSVLGFTPLRRHCLCRLLPPATAQRRQRHPRSGQTQRSDRWPSQERPSSERCSLVTTRIG
jgi:hypothetical protein